MAYHRVVWDHEKSQFNRAARALIDGKPNTSGWRFILLPFLAGQYLGWRRRVRFTAKNLLLTKQFAFNVAREVMDGKDRHFALGSVDIKTRELLRSEKQGMYSEKIRKRQLEEIAFLTDHYTLLLKTPGRSFRDIVQTAYGSKASWLNFLRDLEERESVVIQAALATVRKGSKRERSEWFRRVQETTKQIRNDEADQMFAEDDGYSS